MQGFKVTLLMILCWLIVVLWITDRAKNCFDGVYDGLARSLLRLKGQITLRGCGDGLRRRWQVAGQVACVARGRPSDLVAGAHAACTERARF